MAEANVMSAKESEVLIAEIFGLRILNKKYNITKAITWTSTGVLMVPTCGKNV